MKSIILPVIAAFLIASVSYAIPFSPTLLKLSAPAALKYEFTGEELDIPVTVSGTPAAGYLMVYTKDRSDQIINVTNGFLGWHYMNKVDTCVYLSNLLNLNMGNNTIKWSGKDKANGLLAAGEYTYYIWAYDNVSMGTLMSASSQIDFRASGNMGIIQEVGMDGTPLTNPVFYSGIRSTSAGQTIHKWVIGSDPADTSVVESCYFKPQGTYSFAGGVIALQPDNHNNFFWEYGNRDLKCQYIEKRTWVPNGASEIVIEWGDNGRFVMDQAYEESEPGVIADGRGYLFTGDGNRKIWKEPDADFYVLDINDGSLVRKFDMTAWWSSVDDLNAGGQMNGGPDTGFVMRGGYVFLSGGDSCMKQMVDPYAEDETTFYRWTNRNGDYVLDWNFDPQAARPWVCRDLGVAPYNFNWAVDSNLFSMGSAYDLGAVTWGLLAPDGTGIGYISTAGETAAWKWGAIYVDSGSAYDGIYKDQSNNVRTIGTHQLYFLGHDSIKGIISNSIGVKEQKPVLFTVAQNTPNPFNPSTSITFSIPSAGKVTIDIFNAAGQKVDTLIDRTMSAGSHTVKWNASSFGAGIYFSTIHAAGVSITIRMTLVK